MNDINKKSTSNQMRILMKRMREGKYDANESKETPKKNLDMRDMLKITRKLNEDINNNEARNKAQNKETVYDQSIEQQKMINFFRDLNVNLRFVDLEVYDSLVFFGGIVDGIIKFAYSVTPDNETSNLEFDYSPEFSPDDPQNDEIIKRLEAYYEVFSKYWQNNLLQKDK